MSTIVLLVGLAMFALGAVALTGANDAVARERKMTDAANLRATIAQSEADAYHAALLWARVEAATAHVRADWAGRRPSAVPEPTPLHDDLAIVRFRRELDEFEGDVS